MDCKILDIPFYVRVEWYTGDITIELVIGESVEYFYFDFNKNKSWYAPKHFCIKINKV